jgi:hypothetical protein
LLSSFIANMKHSSWSISDTVLNSSIAQGKERKHRRNKKNWFHFADTGMTVDKAEELLETVISGICDCTLQSRSLISLNVISFRGFSDAGFRQCLNMQQTKWPNSA